MTIMTNAKLGRPTTVASALVLCALLTGCDVTNPGPVQDEFLGDPQSQPGLIYGAQRSIATNYPNNVQDMGHVAREIFPGGQTGAWGNPVFIHAGNVQPEFGPGFDAFHEARFIAETAIKRFTEAGSTDDLMYQAHLWAGIAYRILGEWWCHTVLPSEDPTVTTPGEYFEGTTDPYFERAVDNFTDALAYATTAEQEAAAYAFRASANLWLERWDQAYADAGQVPDDFVFIIESDASESALYNDLYEANSGTFRSYTVQFTWFYDYYSSDTTSDTTNTGDPRTPWSVDPDFDVAVGSLSGFPGGAVPYKPQQKYASRSDDIRLASGWEMRLVEAEAILQGAGSGAWNDAMSLVNQVRTRNISDISGAALAPWTATGETEAWTFLKRERGIELWLEGRRMGDLRRWDELDTPGGVDDPGWEDPSHPGHTSLFLEYGRGPFCWDIPGNERDANPNVPQSGG